MVFQLAECWYYSSCTERSVNITELAVRGFITCSEELQDETRQARSPRTPGGEVLFSLFCKHGNFPLLAVISEL